MNKRQRDEETGGEEESLILKRIKRESSSELLYCDQNQSLFFSQLVNPFPDFLCLELFPRLPESSLCSLRGTCKRLLLMIQSPSVLPLSLYVASVELWNRTLCIDNEKTNLWGPPPPELVITWADVSFLHWQSKREKISGVTLDQVLKIPTGLSIKNDEQSFDFDYDIQQLIQDVCMKDMYLNLIALDLSDFNFYIKNLDALPPKLESLSLKLVCEGFIYNTREIVKNNPHQSGTRWFDYDPNEKYAPCAREGMYSDVFENPKLKAVDEWVRIGPILKPTIGLIRSAQKGGTLKDLYIEISSDQMSINMSNEGSDLVDIVISCAQVIYLPEDSPVEKLSIMAPLVILPLSFPKNLESLTVSGDYIYTECFYNPENGVDEKAGGGFLRYVKTFTCMVSLLQILDPDEIVNSSITTDVTAATAFFSSYAKIPIHICAPLLEEISFTVLFEDLALMANEMPNVKFSVPEQIKSLRLLFVSSDVDPAQSVVPENMSIKEWLRKSIPPHIKELTLKWDMPIPLDSFPYMPNLTSLLLSSLYLPPHYERQEAFLYIEKTLPSLRDFKFSYNVRHCRPPEIYSSYMISPNFIGVDGVIPDYVTDLTVCLYRDVRALTIYRDSQKDTTSDNLNLNTTTDPVEVTLHGIPENLKSLSIRSSLFNEESNMEITFVPGKGSILPKEYASKPLVNVEIHQLSTFPNSCDVYFDRNTVRIITTPISSKITLNGTCAW